ncbi:DEAD/DEAH box helicase [Candidatus Saccharibacteria bacterium]|nr:DEAD/DEAH box helicase [Candidatus Saccharibacteria bacterium]
MNEMPPEIKKTNADIPVPSENNPFTNYAEGISQYIDETAKRDVLRPHQLDVFYDLKKFFEDGGTRGYINLPTGTGKTVLFVEMIKALRESQSADSEKPKILVVVPTKDLVHQTLGRTGEKGFGRFAPDLSVGSYFSDTSVEEKTRANIADYDVVVTTYRSFEIMSSRFKMAPVVDFERDVLGSSAFKNLARKLGYELALETFKNAKYMPTNETLLGAFDIFVLDEAHHALGATAGNLVQALPEEKLVLGFTATPDADEERQLHNQLPYKIHELELNEAISMGLLAPLAPVGIKSGMRIQGSNIYNESGDFIDDRISYLAQDPGRNAIIVKAAKILAGEGVGTIISCIAGDHAWHARYLAQLLQEDGTNAVAVHSGISAKERQKIYQEFSEGTIDVITFIRVLGEGWDSPRAKGLINARPTRSLIVAKQRLGRITRPGNIAYAIDICDEYDAENPIINVADVLNDGNVAFGTIAGLVGSKNEINVFDLLKQNTQVLEVLTSDYGSYQQLLSELPKTIKGVLLDRFGKSEYATSSVAYRNYTGITEEIIDRAEELSGEYINKKLARQGNSARNVYNIKEIQRLISSLPLIDPSRYYIDPEDTKWVSTEGIAKLFSKSYPEVSETIIDVITLTLSEVLDWVPVRFERHTESAEYRHYGVIKMYEASQQMVDSINIALSEYFSQT